MPPRRTGTDARPSRTRGTIDRKSTRLNSSHTEIYTLSLHDALPIFKSRTNLCSRDVISVMVDAAAAYRNGCTSIPNSRDNRSEEHTSELQSHRDLHSFPTRRSSDLQIPDEPLQPRRDLSHGRCRRGVPERMHVHPELAGQ